LDVCASKALYEFRRDVVVADNRIDLGWFANLVWTDHTELARVRDSDYLPLMFNDLTEDQGLIGLDDRETVLWVGE
jgi:hypothetical protein